MPGVTNRVIAQWIAKDIAEHGVEIAPDGTIYALVHVRHSCGNDPVVLHLARVNLSSLILLAEGLPFSAYGLHSGYLREAKQPWPTLAQDLRTRSGNK